MKKLTAVVLTCMVAFAVVAQISVEERKKRGSYNAIARMKVVLCCIDQGGHPLSDVMVWSGVSLDGNPETFTPISGKTDTNGCFVVEGKSYGELDYVCAKEGFYETRETKRLQQNPIVTVSHGRWQPYGMTNTVVLKRKVNPVAMYCKKVSVDIPEKEKDFGFDCMAGDLVRPHGNGRIADFYLNYSLVYDTNNVWNATNHLALIFGPHDGGVIMQADETSQMRTLYSAPDCGYTNQIVFYLKSIDRMHQTKKVFRGDEYIVFSSRSEIDQHGNVTNTHFGKILGRSFWYGEKSKDGAGGRVVFSYYFNPNANDRNIEFDGVNNLFHPDWRDHDWPRAP
jgi:hypothetical protein